MYRPIGANVPVGPVMAEPSGRKYKGYDFPETSRNHATVEFRDHGLLFDPCKGDDKCQLAEAEEFIRSARAAAKVESKKVVVLTFIHGNLNNASNKVDNYPHFEQLLNCLNLGGEAYRQKYMRSGALTGVWYMEDGGKNNLKEFVTCENVPAPADILYVGVYIGWRGRVFAPVSLAQNGAMRIGRGEDIVKTLFHLRDAAKATDKVRFGEEPARFVVIGHSFGGLMLEQAAIQIFQSAYGSLDDSAMRPCPTDLPARGYRPFTDQVITLNAAVNSVPAKHLLDFFRPRSHCSATQT